MARVLRKSIALIAAYLVVLQGLFAGLALAAHVGLNPGSVICATRYLPDQGGVPDHQDNECDKCMLACGAASPVTLTPDAVIFRSTIFDIERPVYWFAAPPPSQKHQPHSSRAPPIAA
jgi:hypothetical protein